MRTSPLRRLAALGVSLLVAGCSVFGGRAAPEPGYETLVSEPPFEIRRYEPMVLARTVVDAPYDEATSEGFSRLFDYISGENRGAREIAMTAPVIAEAQGEREGEEIAMTAPVLAEKEAEGWAVAFVLPGDYTAETAPEPTDEGIEIVSVPARRVAVARYSGFFSRSNAEEARRDLLGWLEARGEAPAGRWAAAGYNPPWTLPPLRRNEVMIPLED